MRRKNLNIVDDMALSRLEDELATRANITQPHLAGIEKGKIDPKIGTLRQIYQGLSCDLAVEPRPQKPFEELLRGQARSLALKRLKRTMGSMALEGQAPGEDNFRRLLEKRTDEILQDRRERLWQKKND
jgi:transcriptional regulator with XRE-family HTH domain